MKRTAKVILAAAVATAMFGANAYAGTPHKHHGNDRNEGLALAAGIVNLVRTVIDPVGTAICPTPGCEPIIRPAVRYNPPPHHAERRAPEPAPRKAAPPKAKERRKAEPAPRRQTAPQRQGRRR